MTIIDSFLDTAKKYPLHRAVTDKTGSFTYTQLNRLSALAAAEILLHAGSGCRNIAVILPRVKEALAAFLGVLRSGNCYVYSAPDAPAERLSFILDDAEISCVLTTENAVSMLKDSSVLAGRQILLMEKLEERIAAGEAPDERINRSECNQPALINYTSGSTGKPKGAVDSYHYIDNHNAARLQFYTPAPNESIGSIVSFSYAASTYDLYSGLTVGCNLYIFCEEELLNQAVLVSKIKEQNVTAMFMIPSMIPVVFAPGAELPVKCIVTAGEKAKQIPEISAKIAEIYGSSEAAAVIGRIAKPGDSWDLLGKPVPGNTLYLADENGNLITEPGKEGELCVVNDAIILEYRNRPEETAKKIVRCPFPGEDADSGRRMFLTGDLMRFDAEGNYYYCGRKDSMTKINGQRVEMGEIEAAVVQHPEVADAVCYVCSANGISVLACCYIPENLSSGDLSESIARFTAEKLPGYMVPKFFLRAESFPKNINGKVDRKRLPQPQPDVGTLCVPPSDYMERILLEAAEKLLPDVRFGVTDDLSKLGMDSIRTVRFVGEISRYDARITASDVMRLKNIRDILSAPKDTAWFHSEPDKRKPVLVLVNGIVPVSGFAKIYDCWGEFFNILVIAPFPDYIETEVGAYDYELLVSYYEDLIRRKLPDGAELWGFAGFSFGGQLAISLADRWQKRTGEYKNVFMGDTLMKWIYPGRKFPVLTKDDPYIRMVTERSRKYGESSVREPLEEILRKQNAVIALLNTLKTNTSYDGPVLYLDAKADYDDITEQLKLSAVRGLYSNVKIIEFSDYFHNDLYMKQEVFAFYRNLFLLMRKKQTVKPEAEQ